MTSTIRCSTMIACRTTCANHLERVYSRQARERYLEIFEELRAKLGYADYLGALERYRLENLHDPRLLKMANWLVDYPFATAPLSACLRGGETGSKLGPDGDPVRRRRGLSAAQGRTLGPVEGLRRPRADLRPQGEGAGRRREVVSGQALRHGRRQAADPRRDQKAVERPGDDRLSQTGSLRP